MKMKAIPEMIMTIQLVHLQPRYLFICQNILWFLEDGDQFYCVENPPIIGPHVGPLNGPIDQIEKANAR